MCVGACMCVYAHTHTLRVVIFSNSTVWLHSNKIPPLPHHPSVVFFFFFSSVRAFEQGYLKTTLPCECTTLPEWQHSMCVSVCVAHAAYLPHNWTHERSSAVLLADIDVVSLNITEGFKVCPTLIQWLLFPARAFILFFHSIVFLSPFHTFSISSHSKDEILCALTITLNPPTPNHPPAPCSVSPL